MLMWGAFFFALVPVVALAQHMVSPLTKSLN